MAIDETLRNDARCNVNVRCDAQKRRATVREKARSHGCSSGIWQESSIFRGKYDNRSRMLRKSIILSRKVLIVRKKLKNDGDLQHFARKKASAHKYDGDLQHLAGSSADGRGQRSEGRWQRKRIMRKHRRGYERTNENANRKDPPIRQVFDHRHSSSLRQHSVFKLAARPRAYK